MVTHTCYCYDWMEWLTNFSFFFPSWTTWKFCLIIEGSYLFSVFIQLLRGNATEYSWTCVKWLHLMWSPWFKWSVFKVRNFFSSLTPISDQDWISPNNFETTLSRQVMRIRKIWIRELSVDPIPNSPKQHHENCMADSKENY